MSEINVAQPTVSGTRTDRPTLTQLLDQLRPGDTLVVWKLDRLGRSLHHLVDTVTSLADRGIGFRSLQEAIDTATPGGKLVFHVFAALAEFERDLIRERTGAGLAAARARGRHGEHVFEEVGMAARCSFCGSTTGPFSKVEGLFTVLMCADCQAARGYGSGPYLVMTRAEMRGGLDLMATWALEGI